MRVKRLQALAVKRSAAGNPARRHPNRDRAWHPRAPIERGRLVDDLIEPRRGKIRILHLDDRAHAFDGRANGRPHHGVLADRRVQHPPGKFLRQLLGRFERAAEGAHVLSVNEDTRIVRQRFGLRLPNRLQVGDAHAGPEGSGVSNNSLKWREASAHQFSL